jgi:hypothetical protein
VQFSNDITSAKSTVGNKFLGTSAILYPLKLVEKVSVGGLTPGQSYRFAVVATNMAGTSQLSESSEEHFVPKAPNQPTITSVSAIGPGSALITYAVSESEFTAPITSFTITANPGGLQSTVTSPLLRSHTFNGLSPLTNYTFTITADSEAGSSISSEQSTSVRTYAPQPPSEPVQTSSTPSTPASIAVPVIVLSSTSETSTTGVALAGYTITSTGGAVASYSISTSAPAGLTFNTSTGLLSGTPTVVASSTIYTITGTNATGSSTATFDLIVVLGAPAFTISVASESAATSSSIAGYSITSTRGAIASYSISPSAPAGLTFNTLTGLLSGAPTNIASSTPYTITGTNAAGSATATFDLTVTLGAPSFTLSSSSESRIVNTAATGFTVTSTGGEVASYSISPSAPTGMSFSSAGAFTGTPTTIAGATAYTITATNATGSSTATFTFTVVVAAPVFTLSSSSENRATGSSLTGYTITSTGGAVATYSISPSAPAGLDFSTSTGLLSGSPTSVASAKIYTITATNTSGTATATFELTVTLGTPAFSLSSISETRAAGTALSGYTISSTGGKIDSYSIAPSAPTGLTFSTSTGLLSGTPTVPASTTTYTITATNTTRSSTAEFALTVNVGAASKAMITTQPSGAVNGVALTTQPVVRITDSSENTVTTSTASVVASIASGTGTLSGTTTVIAVDGVATFADLVLSGTPENFTLTFTPTSLTAATSSSFVLSVGAASKATITTQASGAFDGTVFSTQPVVHITDAGGNTITSSTADVVVSIASGSGTLGGTTTVAAVNGVATFTNLKITGTGNHTLTFTAAGGLTAATSITVSVAELNCALGGSCILNDTGPGGGKVFYIAAGGFKCGPTFESTCHYLEVAPNTWSGSADPGDLYWDPTPNSDENFLETIPRSNSPHLLTTEIGLGYKNSVLIVNKYEAQRDNSAGFSVFRQYAAGAARSYAGGGKSDWYLGSAVEMNLLCYWSKGKSVTTISQCGNGVMTQGDFELGTAGYWTSSERFDCFCDSFKQTFTNPAASFSEHKWTYAGYVRPIRAF